MIDRLSSFPRARLAELPTPVAPLAGIGESYGHDRLFMKQDNLSGPDYGGNKIRKLEFLLGEALAEGRRRVITYGAAGSNHAVATAVCCRRLGLKAVSILAPQPPSDHVRRNILTGFAAGAELHLLPHYDAFPEATRRLCDKYRRIDGIDPYIIPAGGTNATGALGFVNAAFELAEQLQPDSVYIPMGTGGTLAGLLVGFRLVDMPIRIEAVRVVEPAFRNRDHVLHLCGELCRKLGLKPMIEAADILIRDEFFGDGYGNPTPEGVAAMELFHAREHLELEGTYTGKTAAALLHDLAVGALDGRSVLYWNTLNSRKTTLAVETADLRELPPEFRPYL